MNIMTNNTLQQNAVSLINASRENISEAARRIAQSTHEEGVVTSTGSAKSDSPPANDDKSINENLVYMAVNKRNALAAITMLDIDRENQQRLLDVMA